MTTHTLKLPHLYDKQKQAIYADARYVVIEASTKSGKTVGCLAWLMDQAWRNDKTGRNYWWIAPIYAQAKIAYSRMKRMLQRADPSKEIWSCNESDLWIEMHGDSRIWFKGADDPDSLFGEDVYACVIDEATRCKEDAWYAIRSTLTATRGPVRIIGNVKGRKNWAYNMARKAEANEPDMAYAKITAHDAVEAGVLAAEEIEDAKRQLPEQVFNELYLAIPSDDGGNPFGLRAIRECIRPMDDPRPAVAYWGIDLAKSHDWTVAIALDAKGNVCGFQRWQSNWHNTGVRLAAMVKDIPALVDSTGVGDPIVEELQRQCGNVEGYHFTSQSKQKLMEGLAYAIHNKTVHYPEGVIVNELESFEYEYKPSGVRYTAPEGLHDDCVCALALAVMCRASAPAPSTLTSIRMSEEVDVYATGYDPEDDDRMWSNNIS